MQRYTETENKLRKQLQDAASVIEYLAFLYGEAMNTLAQYEDVTQEEEIFYKVLNQYEN